MIGTIARLGLQLALAAVILVALTLLRPGQRSAGAGLDTWIAEHARRADLAWTRSCPIALSNGLCLAEGPPPSNDRTSRPTQCGPESEGRTVVVARDRARRDAALAGYAAIIASFEQVGGRTGGDELAARRAYVSARRALVDVELEQLLARSAPVVRVESNSDQWTARRTALGGWFGGVLEQAERLRARYVALASIADPLATVVASARQAQISQYVFQALLSVPIRRAASMEQPVFDAYVETFCDAICELADPHEQQSTTAWRSCVDTASRSGRAETDIGQLRELAHWSKLCTSELAAVAPNKTSPLREVLRSGERDDRLELVELHLELHNYADAERLAAATPTIAAYDRENAIAVARRGHGQFEAAEVAYQRAIALDPTRPEAFYNLALLYNHRAMNVDVAETLALYAAAIGHLESAAKRATGRLATETADQLAITRKTVASTEQFLRAHADHRR